MKDVHCNIIICNNIYVILLRYRCIFRDLTRKFAARFLFYKNH